MPGGGDHLADVAPDERVLERLGLRSGDFLLAVASDNPTKNLPALVTAFGRRRVAQPASLVIVGGRNEQVFAADGVERDPPGVLRAGPVSDPELKALYGHATALVFPSTYEGFGLPPLEAMACGCPVGAADAAVIPETCGDAALSFDPASVEALTTSMERLGTDAPLRESLRARGRARAAAFKWKDAARTLLATLAEGAHA